MAYVPTLPPQEPERLAEWALEELVRVSAALEVLEPSAVHLVPLYAAPSRPRLGMIVYADGTAWNPGGGRGVYQYDDSTWVKL